MELPLETIERYRKIFQEDYGMTLSDAEIREVDSSMVALFKVIYRPIPIENSAQQTT